MSSAVIAALILWIATTTGWAPIKPPLVKPVECQLAIEWGGYVRGFYESGKIFLMETDDKVTLVHELVHRFQDVQGRLTVLHRKMSISECEAMYKSEEEAYGIENIYRVQSNLPKASLFSAAVVRLDCIERASGGY